MSLVLSNKGKGMQSSSEQPLVGEERYVTTRITAAKETTHPKNWMSQSSFNLSNPFLIFAHDQSPRVINILKFTTAWQF